MLQLDRVAQNLGRNYSDRHARLVSLLQAAQRVSGREAQEKTRREIVTNRPFMAAQVPQNLESSLVGSHEQAVEYPSPHPSPLPLREGAGSQLSHATARGEPVEPSG